MLKKFIVTAALMGVTAYSYGQGTVIFDTKAVGARVLYTVQGDSAAPTPATGNSPVPAGLGTPFYGQLYAAAGTVTAGNEGSLQAVGTRLAFRGGGNPASSNAGFLQDTTPVTLPTATPGGPATVQVRAWVGAETYDAAKLLADANTIGSGAGWSPLLSLSKTADPSNPTDLPGDLVGLQGFTFEVKNIPEPSTVALGVLGTAALLFARRRK
jgi:hypothetical protein